MGENWLDGNEGMHARRTAVSYDEFIYGNGGQMSTQSDF